MPEHSDTAAAFLGLLSDVRDRLGQVANALESREDSVADAGAVAAPAAGAVIAQIPKDRLPPGLYEVRVLSYNNGAGAGDPCNLQLHRGQQRITDLLCGLSTSVGARDLIVSLDGFSDLTITAIAAGAGATYMAEIVATRISRRRPRT